MLGGDSVELRQGIENLMSAFRPFIDVDGRPVPGKLVYHFPEHIRFLRCVFAGGLDKPVQRGETFAVFHLRFTAHDPFWYSNDEVEKSYLFNATFTAWFPWQYPWRTSVAGIYADVLIQLNESWHVSPVFEVRGPLGELVLENLTVGVQLKVNYELEKDERFFVDMKEKNDPIGRWD